LTKLNYGKIRLWLNRAKANWQFVFYIQVTALTVAEFGWSWWYIPFVIVFVLFSLYDIEKGIRQEQDYLTAKNTRFMEIYKMLKRKGLL